MKLPLLFLIVYYFVVHTTYASSILQIDTTQLVNNAELVFEGEVLTSRSEQASSGYIYTYVDFLVTDVLIGNVVAGTVLPLRFTGGTVGDLKLDVGSVIPTMGEHGVYFIESLDKPLINPLLGWSQGHFRIQLDGSLLAGNNQTVVEMNSKRQSKMSLSEGVANGVVTSFLNKSKTSEPTTQNIKPISIATFKSLILQLKR
jgi:hypothetical protein